MHRIRKIGVLTGGGDCPGLNAVIRAVTKTAIARYNIDVVGVEDGFQGLIENRTRELSFDDVSHILDVGGTILGTSNKANPTRYAVGLNKDGSPRFENVMDKVIANIEKNEIDAMVCIGGDGTMTVASELIPFNIPIMGIPKTIDNDIMHTDITFGFDTAVSIATEAMDRIRTTASSHHRVMLVEMMGRNAGWLTLHSGIASGADIILIPEKPYTIGAVCEACVRRRERGKNYTIIAVAEGAFAKGGKVVVDRVVHESPDPIRLGGVSEVLSEEISECVQFETRATILGHVQRGGTPTAFDRVLASQFGNHAMNLLMNENYNQMVAMQNGTLTSVPVMSVADQQRLIPADEPLLQMCNDIGVSFCD